jgi:hypothetical protein
MKTGIILIAAIIITATAICPAAAISAEEIDTGSLDIPELEALDFSETPLGSLESLLTYSERLIKAAEALLDFIDSIFSMLGMEDNTDVENLLNILDEGMNLTKK